MTTPKNLILSHSRSRWGLWASVAVSAALLTGCGGAAGTSATSPPTVRGSGAPLAGGSDIPSGTAPPLSEAELTWLDGFNKLSRSLNGVPTSKEARKLSDDHDFEQHLRGCSRALAQMGSPSERLRPVYTSTKQACRHYDKAAACAHTLASNAVGSPRQASEAVDCVNAGTLDGSRLLADAKIKAFQIKADTGDV